MSAQLSFLHRLALPLIAAPMLRVSGLELVSAACKHGVVGAFPTANCRSTDELDSWLSRLQQEARLANVAGRLHAPFCPNLIMRRDSRTLASEIAVLGKHKTQIVITSVGSPTAVVSPLHDVGCQVLADVATLAHAHKALEAGADGLVLLTAGAGGQTGWANPFAFVRAVRSFYAGPIVLAGGLSDGVALHAAIELGCTLGYMGTRFIATQESLASQAYKDMLVSSVLDDIQLTRAITGLPANFLRPSLRDAGLDASKLDESISIDEARARYGGGVTDHLRPQRWSNIWSAGHSVSGIDSILSCGDLIAQLRNEYESSRVKNTRCR